MPTQKQNKAKEIIGKIFRQPDVVYGLKEFKDITDFEDILRITEESKGRFYVKDLKSKKLKLVFDELKQKGRPEEIIRQLWLYKLNVDYKYPFDRIDTEKSIHFGREVHAKSADLIIYKKDTKGNFASDPDGRKIVDHDLNEIAEAFLKFAKEQKFSFWE